MRIDFKGGRLGYSPDYFREFYFNLAKFLRKIIKELKGKKEKLQIKIKNLEEIYNSLRLKEASYSLKTQIEILLHLLEELITPQSEIEIQRQLNIYESLLEAIQKLEDELDNLNKELSETEEKEKNVEELLKEIREIIGEIREFIGEIKESPYIEIYELYEDLYDKKFLSNLIIEIMSRIPEEEKELLEPFSIFSENLQKIITDPFKKRMVLILVPKDPKFFKKIGVKVPEYFYETLEIRAKIIPEIENGKIKEVRLIIEDKTNKKSNRVFVFLKGDKTPEPLYLIYSGKLISRDGLKINRYELEINLEGEIPENFSEVNKFAKFIIVVVPEE